MLEHFDVGEDSSHILISQSKNGKFIIWEIPSYKWYDSYDEVIAMTDFHEKIEDDRDPILMAGIVMVHEDDTYETIISY